MPEHQQKTRRRDTWGSSEAITCREEMRILRLFRAAKETLLAEWNTPPVDAYTARPVMSIQDKRASKARAQLAAWQRKLKLATTKVHKLKARVQYYERQQEPDRIGSETASQ